MKLLFENWRQYLNEAESMPTIKVGSLEVVNARKLWWGKLENFSSRKGSPKIIVIHRGANKPGTTAGTLNSNGTSTHYEVDQNGTIYQYLDPAKYAAWHSGNSNVNAYSIGIDVSGNSWSAKQVANTKNLVSALSSLFGIPRTVLPDTLVDENTKIYRITQKKNVASFLIKNNIGIVRHRNIVPTGCPSDFPVDSLGRPIKTGTILDAIKKLPKLPKDMKKAFEGEPAPKGETEIYPSIDPFLNFGKFGGKQHK